MYACPPMAAKCPSKEPKDDSSKYYREIGTAMIGNQLIIRMERNKNKSKKSRDWEPPCDCDVVEIQRPSSNQGPKILKGLDNNRILFRVESRSDLSKPEDTKTMSQGITYQIGQCRGGPNTNDQCRTFTIYPVLDHPGEQEVHTDRVTDGDQNVFVLRVKKKPPNSDEPKKNIELELRTPKPPILSAAQTASEVPRVELEKKEEKKVVLKHKPKKEVSGKKRKKR
ncbi:uncharacterized protein LOC143146102 [Ptiloglossa arizonensis]|uniref:uncharacterized protein LOC143146102 n=1 Tax=Ptiloglossa arizonensis TaxID=3350558 RepID=UPI003FA06389